MQPTSSITRMDLGLTSEEFNLAADRLGFIGPKVFRIIQVAIQAATYPKRSLEQLLKIANTKRSPRSGYATNENDFGTDSYATEDHGLEGSLDDRELAIYRDVIDAEMGTVNATIDGVLRRFEIDAAAALYDTSVWTGAALTTAVVNEWDDAVNATPIDDIDAARELIVSGSGQEPNALTINRFQFRNLRKCAQIVDKIKTTTPDRIISGKEITIGMIADALDLDFLIIAGAVKNTANDAQARSISRVWSNEYAMLAKVGVTNDLMEPCVGRTFVWDGNGGGGPGSDTELAYLVEERRNPNDTGTIYRCRNDRGIKVTYKQMGHLLSNITT